MRHFVITLCSLLIAVAAWAGDGSPSLDAMEVGATLPPADAPEDGAELAPENEAEPGEGEEKEPVLMPVEAAAVVLNCPAVSTCPETPATCAPGPCAVRDTGACACANPPPGLMCPAGQTIHVQVCPCRCVAMACSLNCVNSSQQSFFCA